MVALLLLVTLPACAGQAGGADPAVPGPDDPRAGDAGSDDGGPEQAGDVPVGTPAPTGPRPDNEARIRPDAVSQRALAWNRVEVLGPRTLRVHVVLGAPPCSVLADVEIDETPERVRIAVFEGREPDADCDGPVPPLAAPRYVDVTLDVPLDGREIVDAAR